MDKYNKKIIADQVRSDNYLANLTTEMQAASVKVVVARRNYNDFMSTPRIGSIISEVLQRDKLLAEYKAACTDFYVIKDLKTKALLDSAEECLHYDIKVEIPISEPCNIIQIDQRLKATA